MKKPEKKLRIAPRRRESRIVRIEVKKEWSAEEALKAHHEALEAGLPDHDPSGPLYQWSALHSLDKEWEAHEAGDKMALFGAIRLCANHDLPLPEWAARVFITGYDKVLNHLAASWDEAFGQPFPKGKHLAAARRNRMLRCAVWLKVKEITEQASPSGPGRPLLRRPPIDVNLFERVGREFGINRTLASELYYQAKKMFALPSDSASS